MRNGTLSRISPPPQKNFPLVYIIVVAVRNGEAAMGGAVGAQRPVLRVMNLKGRLRAAHGHARAAETHLLYNRVPEFLSIRLIGSPPPIPPQANVSPPPPTWALGGRHTRLRERRWGGGTQFRRLDRNSSTLYRIIPSRLKKTSDATFSLKICLLYSSRSRPQLSYRWLHTNFFLF